ELEELSLESFDLTSLAEAGRDIEAWVVLAQHAVYAAIGRVVRGRFQGVHAADACLADLLISRLRSNARRAADVRQDRALA
ncbi:MAG TPA: hypothetical protein VFQ61_35605, partial [Polyangiaceae bacterium]|nr:hypothetical protein [Polyangiaceae bacterium]